MSDRQSNPFQEVTSTATEDAARLTHPGTCLQVPGLFAPTFVKIKDILYSPIHLK